MYIQELCHFLGYIDKLLFCLGLVLLYFCVPVHAAMLPAYTKMVLGPGGMLDCQVATGYSYWQFFYSCCEFFAACITVKVYSCFDYLVVTCMSCRCLSMQVGVRTQSGNCNLFLTVNFDMVYIKFRCTLNIATPSMWYVESNIDERHSLYDMSKLVVSNKLPL